MKKGIFLILFYLIYLSPNLIFAADVSSSKKAKNPFYECFTGDPSEPKKYCTKLPESKNKQPIKVQIS